MRGLPLPSGSFFGPMTVASLRSTVVTLELLASRGTAGSLLKAGLSWRSPVGSAPNLSALVAAAGMVYTWKNLTSLSWFTPEMLVMGVAAAISAGLRVPSLLVSALTG